MLLPRERNSNEVPIMEKRNKTGPPPPSLKPRIRVKENVQLVPARDGAPVPPPPQTPGTPESTGYVWRGGRGFY